MTTETTFAELVRWRRKLIGLTQTDLADRVGCSVVMIRKLEAGERRPSEEMAERLASSLSIAAEDRDTFIQSALGRASGRGLFKRATNLPAQLTPLIGRERESREIRHRLIHQDIRLLTLLGPAGIGKTRLAVDIAAELINRYEDGVFFVGLAAVSGAAGVAAAIGRVLGAAKSDEADEWAVLETLRDKHMLLILDNFEQVIAARALVATMLKECLWLSILVTSQEQLRIRGEHVFRVPPLGLPEPGLPLAAADAGAYGALALFADRAAAANPDFALTAENIGAVGEICRRLDALPLAIELVAAHSAVLDPAALLLRLNRRLALLIDGPADLPERHRTLRAAIAWGYELLQPAEKALFARLAVFIDGFSLRAAEAIGADEAGAPEAVLTLAALANKSMLVQQELPDGAIRFKMLETVRDFALELLDQAGAAEDARRRHAAYFAGLSGELRSGASPELLQGEQANLGAALHWALERGEARIAIQLAEITWTLQRHLSTALASSRASNQLLESLVAERTADLQAALNQVEERERRLTALNAELLQARAAAEDANYLKTRFLANLSHEFHTILNVIINFTSFLSDQEYGALNRRQQFFQRRLEANAEYLLDLIHDIMDFSQVEMGALELSLEDVDLAAVAREVVPAAAGFTRDKGLRIQVAAEEGLPAARGDRRWMRQIFLNLLWYLARLTSRRSLNVQLWSEDDGMVRCAIDDGGQRRRIAEPAPLSAAPASFNDGELRFAISRAFIELHGGDIALGGDPQQGLAIVFALPAASPGPDSAGSA